MKTMLSFHPKKRPTIVKIKNHLTEWNARLRRESPIPMDEDTVIFAALGALLIGIMRYTPSPLLESKLPKIERVPTRYKIESKNPRQKMKKDYKMLQ